jgi:hypothetical protein
MARIIPAEKQTNWYLHCATCGDERLCVCLTQIGVQVWCNRCDHNVAHFDFAGHKLCVNMMTGPTFGTRVPALVEDQQARDFWRRRKHG